MTQPETSVTAIAAAIESSTDGRWAIWQSDTGWWWATRTQSLTASELTAGCLPFTHADNPDELTERIRQQDNLCPPPPAGEHP